MVEQLLSQVIVQCLLAAVICVSPFAGAPVRFVEAESHGLALCSAIRASLCGAGFWGVEKGLVALHADERFRATAELCGLL